MSGPSTPTPIKRTRSCTASIPVSRPALRRAFTSAQAPTITVSSATPIQEMKKKAAPSRVLTRTSSRGKENIPPPRDEDQGEPSKRRRMTVEIPTRPMHRERACSVASIRSEFSSTSSTSRLTLDDSPFDFSSSPAPETPRQLASFSSVAIVSDDEAPVSPLNPYKRFKAMLRLSHRDAIVGRESERSSLDSYLEQDRSDALYVTGPPGTGKSALVASVADALQQWKTVTVNCMGLGAASVWERIARGLSIDATEEQLVTDTLVDAASKGRILIILDELDSFMPPPPSSPTPAISHLLSKLFSLPRLSSNIKLVAISNTLDLTLRARLVLPNEPSILPFKPYKAPEMSAIIRARLDASTDAAQVDKNALELLTRKVDAQDGDLRTALACLGSAASLAEADAQRTHLSVKISLKHVITALAGYKPKTAAGSAPANGSSAIARTIRSIPLQARFVLLAAVVALRRKQYSLAGAPAQLTSATLYTAYSQLLSQPTSPYPPSPETDFRDLLSTLESTGILSLPLASSRRKAEIELCAAEKDALEALINGQGEAESVVKRVWEKEEVRMERARERAVEAKREKVDAFCQDV